MKTIKQHSYAAVGLVLASMFFVFTRFIEVNPFDVILRFLAWLATLDVDETIALSIFLIGCLIDLVIAYRRQTQLARVQAQKLDTLRATMRTVHDLVFNFLNNLQWFRMEAEDGLSAESINKFDALIHETAQKLRALGDVEEIKEIEGPSGRHIEYEA